MLITFERVWAVGRFDVGRSLFVVPQQPRAEQSPTGGVFEPVRGAPNRNVVLPKLSRDGGVYPLASIAKGGT